MLPARPPRTWVELRLLNGLFFILGFAFLGLLGPPSPVVSPATLVSPISSPQDHAKHGFINLHILYLYDCVCHISRRNESHNYI